MLMVVDVYFGKVVIFCVCGVLVFVGSIVQVIVCLDVMLVWLFVVYIVWLGDLFYVCEVYGVIDVFVVWCIWYVDIVCMLVCGNYDCYVGDLFVDL